MAQKDGPGAHPALLWLLVFLSSTTGLVDAASVLGLGKVFTANMTGNVVFLGFAAAGMPGFDAVAFVVAIATFMVGAVLAGRIGRRLAGQPLRRLLLVSAACEGVLLGSAAVLAIGVDSSDPSSARIFALIALTAIAMGFRNATVRLLKVPDLTTTVLTMTITGLAADSGLAGGDNANWGRRLASITAIFIGATLGVVLLRSFGLSAPLALAGLLVVLGTLACTLHPSSARPLQS